jgi:hypothetical protein
MHKRKEWREDEKFARSIYNAVLFVRFDALTALK